MDANSLGGVATHAAQLLEHAFQEEFVEPIGTRARSDGGGHEGGFGNALSEATIDQGGHGGNTGAGNCGGGAGGISKGGGAGTGGGAGSKAGSGGGAGTGKHGGGGNGSKGGGAGMGSNW